VVRVGLGVNDIQSGRGPKSGDVPVTSMTFGDEAESDRRADGSNLGTCACTSHADRKRPARIRQGLGDPSLPSDRLAGVGCRCHQRGGKSAGSVGQLDVTPLGQQNRAAEPGRGE